VCDREREREREEERDPLLPLFLRSLRPDCVRERESDREREREHVCVYKERGKETKRKREIKPVRV